MTSVDSCGGGCHGLMFGHAQITVISSLTDDGVGMWAQ